jgi:hypothetical protein
MLLISEFLIFSEKLKILDIYTNIIFLLVS